MAEEFISRNEFNGLGGRVSVLDKDVGKHDERITRNREDIVESWSAINDLREDIKNLGAGVAKEIADIRVDIKEENGKLAVKIGGMAGGISVVGLILMAVFQWILKGGG